MKIIKPRTSNEDQVIDKCELNDSYEGSGDKKKLAKTPLKNITKNAFAEGPKVIWPKEIWFEKNTK